VATNKSNEHTAGPTVFVSKDKIVTFTQTGPIQTYVEVDRHKFSVKTTTFVKVTK
jgi:hypothetical protein